MGSLCESGDGVPLDLTEAAELYMKAARTVLESGPHFAFWDPDAVKDAMRKAAEYGHLDAHLPDHELTNAELGRQMKRIHPVYAGVPDHDLGRAFKRKYPKGHPAFHYETPYSEGAGEKME